MVPVRGYADKRVAVLGLQGPGFAAARAFEAGGADVTVWDEDGPQRLHAHKAGLTVEDPTERDWGDLAALVVEDARFLTMEDPPRPSARRCWPRAACWPKPPPATPA